MFSVPVRFVPLKALEQLTNARQRDGAHAYYSNGWAIGRRDGQLTLPSSMVSDAFFTVVFSLLDIKSRHAILFCKTQDDDKSYFALEVDKVFSTVVMEDSHKTDHLSEDLPHIMLKGFHVLQIHMSFQGMNIELDGQLIADNAIQKDPQDYIVFKPQTPGDDHPFVIWEAHQQVPDINANFVPQRIMLHKGISIGIGGSVLMRGDWRTQPVVYIGDVDISTPLKAGLQPGKQIIRVKVYKDDFAISSSEEPNKSWAHPGGVPITGPVHWKRGHVNDFYDYTVIFTDTQYK